MLGPDFRKLWIGQSISFVGSQITSVALPLTAVLVLDATPDQMGWLVAVENLPMALFGLLAGVLADRVRRRPVLVVSDFARAFLLASIPLAAFTGRLGMGQLLAVAFGVGSFYVFAAVADRAYLPELLRRDQLIAGNARIQFSQSAARTMGPGLAGLLVQLLTAPIAIAIDAVSFLVAGLFVRSIRHDERKPTGGGRTWPGMVEGLRRVARDPLLRPLVLCGGTHNICSTMIVAVYILYVTKSLGIGPIVLGVILAMGGVGALFGSLWAPRIARRVGIGPALIVAQALTGVARLLVPLAGGPLLLICSEFLLGMMRALFNVTQISLRQAITPPDWQGRVNASIGFLLWVLTPLGALAGGYLGTGSACGTRSGSPPPASRSPPCGPWHRRCA